MNWIVALLILLFAFPLHAHEYHFRQLPADYGADIRTINLLFQSADGIVWIGTDQGLFSFDGRQYKYVGRIDNAHVNVTAIAASRDGLVWAGYEDGYVLTTNYQGYRHAIDVPALRGTAISKIVFDSSGTVFIATYGLGLWQGDGGFFAPVMYEELSGITDIADAIMDRDGQLWLATDDGIRMYHPLPNRQLTSIKRAEGLRDDIVTRLTLEQDGNILIGLYDLGLQRYDHVQKKLINLADAGFDSGTLINTMQGTDLSRWTVTTNSIWLADHGNANHKLELPVSLQTGLSAALLDRDGNLWVASGAKLYITHTQLEYVDPGLSGIQAILSSGNKLWYGCESGLYSTDIHGENRQTYFTNSHINVLSLYKDEHDVLWIGTFGQGLYILDPKTNRSLHLTEADKLSNSSILNIDGSSRHVWLATLGGITELTWNAHPLDGSLIVSDLQTRFNFPPGYVYDVFVSDQGRTWFGTDGKGLFYLEKEQLHKLPVEARLTDSTTASIRTIYSIAADQHQHLWVSTAKGIVLCLDENLQVIKQTTSTQGLVNSLVVDGTGDVLLVREGEINVISNESQVVGLAGSADLASFTPNINAIAVDSDGSVWIADADRILHYHSATQRAEDGLLLNFEAISPGNGLNENTLVLRPDSNFLDIRFIGLWYADPAAVQYRYKLEGHDVDWIYTQERRAVYSRLSPGTYRFVVQSSRGEDFNYASELQKEIIVLPPFYQRWWFIAGFAALILGTAYWLIRQRINRLNKLHLLEKEKTTHQLHAIQAQVNPHFLFNSFNTLSSIIEEDQQAAVDYVDQLAAFFRGALMHRDDELIPITQEMEIVRNYTYILRKRYGDNIRIIENMEHNTGLVAPLSIQLLVENAIKHNRVSGDKPLTVQITVDLQWVEVRNPIQPKFQPANESTGFGLSSLLTRYAYLTPKKIEVRNVDHTFIVRIPVIYREQTT